jgi:pterin-4a-carbinolamine dehydratase
MRRAAFHAAKQRPATFFRVLEFNSLNRCRHVSGTGASVGLLATSHRGMSSAEENDDVRKLRTKRHDPTAKRPTEKCDPYGQGGKPMSQAEADVYKATLDEEWTFVTADDNHDHPIALVREFLLLQPEYLQGSRLVHKLAAIAEMNAHFPTITLDRQIVRRTWQVVVRVQCQTKVLEGLSANDFHLAMVSFER